MPASLVSVTLVERSIFKIQFFYVFTKSILIFTLYVEYKAGGDARARS